MFVPWRWEDLCEWPSSTSRWFWISWQETLFGFPRTEYANIQVELSFQNFPESNFVFTSLKAWLHPCVVCIWDHHTQIWFPTTVQARAHSLGIRQIKLWTIYISQWKKRFFTGTGRALFLQFNARPSVRNGKNTDSATKGWGSQQCNGGWGSGVTTTTTKKTTRTHTRHNRPRPLICAAQNISQWPRAGLNSKRFIRTIAWQNQLFLHHEVSWNM